MEFMLERTPDGDKVAADEPAALKALDRAA